MDCSLPGSSDHGFFQARILEWVDISFSKRSSRPRDWTRVSQIVGGCFTIWASREDNGDLFKTSHAYTATFSTPKSCSWPQLTHASAGDSWTLTDNIMKNAGLDETQAGIKIARGNVNNLKYADDTTLMAESKEELKSLLMTVKEDSEKVGLTFLNSTFRKLRSWH